MSIEKYYTYIYLDPRKSGDYIYQCGIEEVYCFYYEPFYIGKGIDDRLFWHLNCYNYDKNKHKKNIIKKIRKAGLEPIIIKVLQDVTNEEACNEEINLISIIGRADKNRGPLTNLTDGGDGVRGYTLSEEDKGKRREDLTGQRFNRLVVLYYIKTNKTRNPIWLCQCDCGNKKEVIGYLLKRNTTQSCGCLQKERGSTHNMSKTTIYNIWLRIRELCYKTDHRDHQKYKDNNIEVCVRWKNSFEKFYEDMGDKPTTKHILIRINESKNFEPKNCRWGFKNEVGLRYLTIDGEIKSVKEWSKISGLKPPTILMRLHRGCTDWEAVFKKY